MIKNQTPNTTIDTAQIPPALLVVIEDVGWWSGYDGSSNNEPYRTGLGRMHTPADYIAIIRLARTLNTQIIAGMVLCEWDRKDLLRKLPTATWMGAQWQSPMKHSPFLDQAAAILNQNPDRVEISLHGVGHEFWENGQMSRSEFHTTWGDMRHRDEITKHMTMFGALLESSGIKAPFPRIFIPPALKHSFGQSDSGFQHILSDFGIEYVLTIFDKAKQHAPPKYPNITAECGVTLIERGPAPIPWNTVAPKPDFSFNHPVLPLHWANILHTRPELNNEVVDAWARYIQHGADLHGYLVLPDVTSIITQIIYHMLTRIESDPDGLVLDISAIRCFFSPHVHRGFYVHLPPRATIRESDGIIKPADYNNDNLVMCLPSPHCDRLHILL